MIRRYLERVLESINQALEADRKATQHAQHMALHAERARAEFLVEREAWMTHRRWTNAAPILTAPGGTVTTPPLLTDGADQVTFIPPEWVQGHVDGVSFAHLTVEGDEAARPVRWLPHGQLALHGVVVTHAHGWSSTMPALFGVLPGRMQPPLPVIQEVEAALNAGLDGVDPQVTTHLGALLPPGRYLVSLTYLRPRPVSSGDPGDYLSHELVTLCGARPGVHSTEPYYAGSSRETSEPGSGGVVFRWLDRTVILPTQAASRLNPARLEHYRQVLRAGGRPTAVTLLTTHTQNGMGIPIQTPPLGGIHLDMHHLLDGHHKMQAASECGMPLQTLVFLRLGGMSEGGEEWGWNRLRGRQRMIASMDELARSEVPGDSTGGRPGD